MIDDTGGMPAAAELAVWLDFGRSPPSLSITGPSFPVFTSFSSISGGLVTGSLEDFADFRLLELLSGFEAPPYLRSFT